MATFVRLVRMVPPARATGLALLMLLASLTEGIGLMLLVPLIAVVSGDALGAGPVRGLVDALAASGVPISLAGLLVLFVALVALRSAIQFARETVGIRIERHLIDDLRARAYAALMRAEWRWLANSRRSDHAHVLLSNIDRLGIGVTQGIALVSSAITIAAYGVVALALSPMVTGVVAASGALVFVALAAQRRRALAMGQRLSESKRAMFATVEQGLAGIKLTKILANEARHLGQFSRDMDEMRAQGLAYATSLNLSRALFQLGAAALLAAFLYVGLTWWQVPVPELLTLVLLFARAVPMLMGLQQTLFIWLHAMPAVHEVERLLADTEAQAEPELADDGAEWTLQREISVDAVTISWPERERPALDAVTLAIPARTTLAVIGASGSGKSTLADVVMGMLVPDSGSVSVDGRAVSGSARIGWRRAVAYVPQEVFLFHDSIRANLAWGLRDVGDAEGEEAAMTEALRLAAADFVFDLPRGLDTVVGDSGLRLSGGERQRIALARALLRRPALLILDEATSALDVENELRIRDAIERLHGRLTMIVIGHRLPTLDHADRVIRMSEGRVVAQGSWADIGGMGA